MPITTRMPIRSKTILTFCFSLYAALNLGSMATMGFGAFILFFAIILTTNRSAKTNLLNENDQADFFKEVKIEWHRPEFRGYFLTSCALIAACTLSLLGAKFFPLGYGGKFVEIHFFKDMAKVWYFLWPCILVIGLKRLSEDQRRIVLNTWITTFGLLSLLGIFQYFFGWPRPQPIPGEPGHFHATLFLGHHLSVASIFIFPFFATLDLAYLTYRQKLLGNISKFNFDYKIYPLIAALGFITLFLTYSRTLWIALPLGIILWILLTLPKQFKIVGCISLLLLALGVSQYPPIQRRLHDGIGISTRQDLWLANLEFLKQRPISGVGWLHNQELSGFYLMDKYKTSDVFSGHAHNNFLDILGSQGTLGTIAWLTWCACVIWLLIRQKRTPLAFSKGLMCAWFVFQINGLTQVNFWEAKVEHQLAWAIAWSLL